MALKGIPSFSIHFAGMTVHTGRKIVCEQEYGVVIFAASGISAHSRRVARARVTAVVEWSDKGKKTILHKGR